LRAGQSYGFTYNSFGRPLTVKAGTRTLASYSYGQRNGQLNTLTHGNGDTVAYLYDYLERVTGVRYNCSTSNAVSYAYAGEGNLRQRTDHTAGRIRNYVYDGLGRLLSEAEESAAGDSIAQSNNTYDTANRLQTLTYRISRTWDGTLGNSRTYRYSYRSADGALESLQIPSGTITPVYDGLKRLAGCSLVSSGGNGVFTQSYAYLGGTGTYNTSPLVGSYSISHGSTALQSSGYSYNNAGHILRITGTGAASYSYDRQGPAVV